MFLLYINCLFFKKKKCGGERGKRGRKSEAEKEVEGERKSEERPTEVAGSEQFQHRTAPAPITPSIQTGQGGINLTLCTVFAPVDIFVCTV